MKPNFFSLKLRNIIYIFLTFIIAACNSSNTIRPSNGGTTQIGVLPNGNIVTVSNASFNSNSGQATTGSIFITGGSNSTFQVTPYFEQSGLAANISSVPSPCNLNPINPKFNSCQIIFNPGSTPNGTYKVYFSYQLNNIANNSSQSQSSFSNYINYVISNNISPILGNLAISLARSSIYAGNGSALTVSLSGSSAITTPVNVIITSSSPSIANPVTTSSCALTTVNNSCTITVAGLAAGSASFTASATGYTNATSNSLTVIAEVLNQWIWVGGESVANSDPGIYGTLTIPSITNLPGARTYSTSWTDQSGNLWLFGGTGVASVIGNGFLNDLWKYNTISSMWTWMGGQKVVNAPGVYGTLGTPAASNSPGARQNPISWVDQSGNLWLLGGYGYDSIGNQGVLNDLWKYNITTSMWTWMSGQNVINSSGVYGTLGTPATLNTPGARQGPVSWVDQSGNLWLLGGYGYDSVGNQGVLNDLWKYNITTSMWAWMGGQNTTNGFGVYGTLGTPSTANIPGARNFSISWTDQSGNLWLFGGNGYGSSGSSGYLNDLWKYNPNTGTWAWMGGQNVINGFGLYGTLGTPSTANIPGARYQSISWVDRLGNFWLFGGYSYGVTGTPENINDLWKYNPTNATWTWMGGQNVINDAGTYGTLGVPSPSNLPSARGRSIRWLDQSGNLWLFGGDSIISYYPGNTNDLWRYNL